MPDFKFTSLANFIHMAGHGIYVWSCVLIALVVLSTLIIHPLMLKKAQLARLRKQAVARAQQARQHAQSRSHTPG